MYGCFPCQRVSGSGVLVLTTKDQYWSVFISIAIPAIIIVALFSSLINAIKPSGL